MLSGSQHWLGTAHGPVLHGGPDLHDPWHSYVLIFSGEDTKAQRNSTTSSGHKWRN